MRKIFTTLVLLLLLCSGLYAAGVRTEKNSASERISIFEDVKPSPVRRKPDKMHVGNSRSDDVSIAVGDVIFNPIPNTRR